MSNCEAHGNPTESREFWFVPAWWAWSHRVASPCPPAAGKCPARSHWKSLKIYQWCQSGEMDIVLFDTLLWTKWIWCPFASYLECIWLSSKYFMMASSDISDGTYSKHSTHHQKAAMTFTNPQELSTCLSVWDCLLLELSDQGRGRWEALGRAAHPRASYEVKANGPNEDSKCEGQCVLFDELWHVP